jgi:hypothetical protein
MGPAALLPNRRKVCCGFLSALKSITSAGIEHASLGSSGKHTNHYTTEETEQHTYKQQSYAQRTLYDHRLNPTDLQSRPCQMTVPIIITARCGLVCVLYGHNFAVHVSSFYNVTSLTTVWIRCFNKTPNLL